MTLAYYYHRVIFNTDGRKEAVKFDKVTARVSKLCYGLDMNFVDPIEITRKVRACCVDVCRDYTSKRKRLLLDRSLMEFMKVSQLSNSTIWLPRLLLTRRLLIPIMLSWLLELPSVICTRKHERFLVRSFKTCTTMSTQRTIDTVL